MSSNEPKEYNHPHVWTVEPRIEDAFDRELKEIIGRGATQPIQYFIADEDMATKLNSLADAKEEIKNFRIHNVGFGRGDSHDFGYITVHTIKTKARKITIEGVVENDTDEVFSFTLSFTAGQNPYINILTYIASELKKRDFKYVNFKNSYFTINHVLNDLSEN